MGFRSLMTTLVGRARLANVAGHTFRGKRDLYRALGYQRELFPPDYRSRFRRNGVANRVVKALPKATWRGGAEVIEDEDPTTQTAFEAAFDALNEQLNIWATLARADILAGIGRYAIVLIGAPGDMTTPLERASADDIKYLQPYSEEDAKIYKFDIDPTSPRFGLPVMYNITRTTMLSPDSVNSNVVGKQVHWSRVIHVADGLLDDRIYGEPRLESIWNYLDDLEKVSGGGAEAFWRRADQGTQFDIDPEVEFEGDDVTDPNKSKAMDAFKKQLEEYEHGLRRNLTTRGVTVTPLGSDVADFQNPVNAIIGLISASTGIPQRVLMGSEQGKLAAAMDRSNWDDRVTDRRDDYGGPLVVRPFVQRLIDWGALPRPKDGTFDVRWAQLKVLDDGQRAEIASKWAGLNQAAGETVVTAEEIRDRILGLPKLEEVTAQMEPAAAKVFLRKWVVLSQARQVHFYKLKTSRKGAPAWKHVHQVADRFRTSDQASREGRVPRRA